MQDDASFGHWLQQRRLQLGLTQESLGKHVGLSTNMIHKIEAEDRRPSPEAATQLARYLLVPEAEHAAFRAFARGESSRIVPTALPRELVALPSAALSGTTTAPFDPPRGTVTFLLTDIEGGTILWDQHPEAMRQAMTRHDALVEQMVTRYAGVVMRARAEGDSCLAVFPQATDAVAAAATLQQALHAEPWPTPTPLRVRMALHTGEADLDAGNYYGSAANRCACLRAVANGGQTLVSRATRELTHGSLPAGVDMRDLGAHGIKDLPNTEHLYQLDIAGLPTEFPTFNTRDARLHNLPAQTTLFIGREWETAAVRQRLHDPAVRLLALTGPGGTGKTRLALHVAGDILDAFADGVFLVDLAPVHDPHVVATTIAQTLGVTETSGRSIDENIRQYLSGKHLLLVLDNFEQVLGASPLLAELLAAAPRLKILVTSRAVLQLYGEHEFVVPPLALPDRRHLPPAEDLANYPAVALFVQRARAARSDFKLTPMNATAVADICIRLDGLPLAIELAAARIRLFSPQALLARLDHRLATLTGGSRNVAPRQQTLRGAIDWSYALLSVAEQVLFARLSVFVGSYALEAAEAVCGMDTHVDDAAGVVALMNQSLVQLTVGVEQTDAEDGPRFVMLETLREYARERLVERGEADRLEQRHAEYFLVMAEQAAPELRGRRQTSWLRRLDAEHDNMRAALRWSFEHAATSSGVPFVSALWRFWYARSYLIEGRAWLERALGWHDQMSPAAHTNIVYGAGSLAFAQGDYDAATAFFDEALRLARQQGDQQGIARALSSLGMILDSQGNAVRAREMEEESLAISRQLGDLQSMALSLSHLGSAAVDQAEYERAEQLLEESLALYRELGDHLNIARLLNNLGSAWLEQGEPTRAQARLEESLHLFQDLGSTHGIAFSLSNLGFVALEQQDYSRAATRFKQTLSLLDEVGDKWLVAECLEGLAGVLASQVQQPTATRCAALLAGVAGALRGTIDAPLAPAARLRYERYLAPAYAQLTGPVWDTVSEEGRMMTLEQAFSIVEAQTFVEEYDVQGSAVEDEAPNRLEVSR